MRAYASTSGAELTIACIAQSGKDVARGVQLAVFCGEVDLDRRMGLVQAPDTLRCSDDPNELDMLDAPSCEQVNCGNGRLSGGEHRIQDQIDIRPGDPLEAAVVLH